MGYPFWLSDSNLGTRTAGFSLTAQPIILLYGESESLSCTVSVLNGSLPPGILLNSQVTGQVQLLGELQGVGQTATYAFTLRLNNGTRVSDRTYTITVSQTFSEFYWVTSNTDPLLYVSDNLDNQVQIQAVSEPLAAISYVISNSTTITQGIHIDASSGVITANLAWKPLTTYVAFQDYVINADKLYLCNSGGTSSTNNAPVAQGLYVVDTPYPAWRSRTPYELNDVVHNDVGKVYLCVQPGISGEILGPTGMGPGVITDNTCGWQYMTQSVVWNQVDVNTQVDLLLQCQATRSTQTINREFILKLVSSPAGPIWITDSGLLSQVLPGTFFSYSLQVQEPEKQPLMWMATNLPSWLSLSVLGELYGVAPTVQTTQTYTFSVTVSDGVYPNTQTFQLQVTQTSLGLTWVTPVDLGTTADGVVSDLKVQAQSTQTYSLIEYKLTGGVLCPGLQLNNQSGYLEGFVEHHVQDKTYVFEITATDNQEQITRTFVMHVQSRQMGHYCTFSVPAQGFTKQQLITLNNQNVVLDSQLYLPDSTWWGRTTTPQLILISGLTPINLVSLRQVIAEYFIPFSVSFQNLILSDWTQSAYQSLSVQVQDDQAPALWQPNTYYYTNARVSWITGIQLQAETSGTSGTQPPLLVSDLWQDNSISWRVIASPLTSTSVDHVVPWLPYHAYQLQDCVTNQGYRYICVQAGRSAGALGPTGDQTQTDGGVIWQSLNTETVQNTWYPACITNLQKALLQNLTFSSGGRGQGAQAVCVTDVQGSIQSVIIQNTGIAYARAPRISLTGTGTNGELKAYLGIVQAEIVESGLGIQSGSIFDIDLGTGIPAQAQVVSVNPLTQATQVQILSAGQFECVPTDPIQFNVNDSQITLQLYAGVSHIQVIQAGSGYAADTRIQFRGQAYDPIKQDFQDAITNVMHLAYVSPDVSINGFNPYQDLKFDVPYMQVEITGVEFQGHARWDDHTCVWDGNATEFFEQTPASQCVWDQNLTVWDSQSVTFDRQMIGASPLNQTVFDQETTWFDFLDSIWDQPPVSFQSVTSVKLLWFMGDHVS